MSTPIEALEISADPKITGGEGVASDRQNTIYFPVCKCDPNDIRANLRLAIAAILFAMVSLALAGLRLIINLTEDVKDDDDLIH